MHILHDSLHDSALALVGSNYKISNLQALALGFGSNALSNLGFRSFGKNSGSGLGFKA